jgi:hypothetical protein
MAGTIAVTAAVSAVVRVRCKYVATSEAVIYVYVIPLS